MKLVEKKMNNLVCRSCGRRYSASDPIWRCECGHPLDLEFEASLHLRETPSQTHSIWRYREALPIKDPGDIVSLGEGFTPLVGVKLFGRPVLLKLEFLSPTSSFKDRGASVLISKAKELKVKRVVEDSSGNAGCAIAAYCARAQIECHIYVPESTSPGKVLQVQAYGAQVFKVSGTRADVALAAWEAAREAYYASHVWNPFFLQGTKTLAYEIFEQLGFQVPDQIIFPVGNGTLLIGAYLGFSELLHQGLIERLPEFIAAQAEACSPLYQAYVKKKEEIPEIIPRSTMAEGIAIPQPPRGKQILEVLRKTGGKVLQVKEEEILKGMKALSSQGVLAEPTSAVAVAAFLKTPEERGKRVLIPITGSGLKTPEHYRKIFS